MIKKLKEKRFVILPDTPLDKLSAVSVPAIGVGFQSFSEDELYVSFAAVDKAKHLVIGPAMIPGKRIYRADRLEDGSVDEYMGHFDAESVEMAAEAFMKYNRIHDINKEHQSDIPNAFLTESWIITDPANDKANTLGLVNKDGTPWIPVKGTWMAAGKITDEETWNQVLSGAIGGWSIEGQVCKIAAAEQMAAADNAETRYPDKKHTMPDGSYPIDNEKDLRNAIHAFGRAKDQAAVKAWIVERAHALGRSDLIPMGWNAKKPDATKMSVKDRIMKFMKELFADDVLADKTMISCDGDWGIGDPVTVKITDGSMVPAPDNEYQLSDGTIITTVGGNITEVESAGSEPTESESMSAEKTQEEMVQAEKIEKAAEAVAEVALAEDPAATAVASTEDVQAQLAELKKQVDELVGAGASKDAALAEMTARMEAQATELAESNAKVVKLSAQPATTSVKHSRHDAVRMEHNQSRSDRQMELLEQLRKQA